MDDDLNLSYYSEFLEIGRFGSRDYESLIAKFLSSRYAGQAIDVVVAVGPQALDLLRHHQKDLFAGTPIVFCLVGRGELGSPPLPPNFIGVPVVIEARPTLDLALRLQPDAREIVVVTGASAFDRSWEETLREDLARPPVSIPIRYLSGLPLDGLLQELSRLDPNTIVYTPSILQDGTGRTYFPPAVLHKMSQVATAPLYDPYGTHIGSGVVGGYFFTTQEVGQQAGELVVRLLNGETIKESSLPDALPSSFVVDWNQLQRWHLNESRLPPETVIKFRPLSPWQEYRNYILAGAAALVLQMILILAFAIEARKRRRSELELKRLSARLINSQEAERRRIARELHDDFSQRLALLTADIAGLAEPDEKLTVDERILGISRDASNIAVDVSQLSHRLHSSALDLLGLVSALRRLTKDLGRTYRLNIDFTSSGDFSAIPPDVALCLFRVAQEALMNVVKHSGAKSAEVQLSSENKDSLIHLRITDDGKGFDPARVETDSLGIISMRERLRIVGGVLKIVSHQAKGTQIRAQVPRRDASDPHETPRTAVET